MEQHRSTPSAAPDPDAIRRAQIGEFARLTPINTFVTITVALGTAAILASTAPAGGLVAWLVVQEGTAIALLARWLARRRRIHGGGPVSPRAIRRATGYALASGLVWGTLPLLMRGATPMQTTAVSIVVASMAAGSTTTLAAIPAAAVSFVFASLLPFVAFFALRRDPTGALLALLAACFMAAMIAASRLVHGTFLAAVRARLENAAILERFYAERQDWVEVSETTDAFALLDSEGRLLLWNRNLARFLSLEEHTLERGVPLREVLRRGAAPNASAGPALESWVDALLASAAGEGTGERPALEFDNGRWLRAEARRTARGNFSVVFTELTALKRAERAVLEREAALAEAQRLEAIGKLAGGIAHDFNNLLTVISGFAEALEAELVERPEERRHAERIRQACERAASLTRQLLAYGRRQTLQPRVVELNALVREAYAMLARLVPEHVELALDLHAAPLPIRVDPGELERALVNLVINARDVLPRGGRVWIRTREVERSASAVDGTIRSGRWGALSVSDDGPGMDAETRARIFEPFFTTKPEGRGSGLGLATVYGSVVQSGGVVEVDSAPGRGSTFRILLPETDLIPDAPRPAAGDPVPISGRAVVLLVEDEPVVRELVVELLGRAGYEVLPAARPTAALELCKDHRERIDLILSDVVMPELSGPDFVERALRIVPGVPVVYISGYAEEALGAHGATDPSVVILRKPFTSAELRSAIATELAASGRLSSRRET